VITVVEAAGRVGRSPETVRRWIRTGRLPASRDRGRLLLDARDIDTVRDELYPMLPLPEEWQQLEDGTPAPNWVAAVALSRSGRRSSS
jgi:excisionase family DNA binding protein